MKRREFLQGCALAITGAAVGAALPAPPVFHSGGLVGSRRWQMRWDEGRPLRSAEVDALYGGGKTITIVLEGRQLGVAVTPSTNRRALARRR